MRWLRAGAAIAFAGIVAGCGADQRANKISAQEQVICGNFYLEGRIADIARARKDMYTLYLLMGGEFKDVSTPAQPGASALWYKTDVSFRMGAGIISLRGYSDYPNGPATGANMRVVWTDIVPLPTATVTTVPCTWPDAQSNFVRIKAFFSERWKVQDIPPEPARLEKISADSAPIPSPSGR